MKKEQFFIDGLIVDVDLLLDRNLSDYQDKYIWVIQGIYKGSHDITEYVLKDPLQMLIIKQELYDIFGTYEEAVQ